MTDAEIIQSFRDKAKLYTRMANDLERALGLSTVKKNGAHNAPELPKLAKLTLEEIRSSLRTKGGRLHHVAARLNASEEEVADLIEQPGSGISIAPRGWLKLDDEGA